MLYLYQVRLKFKQLLRCKVIKYKTPIKLLNIVAFDHFVMDILAYLLKPVQRLTKYQLLLGQLVKYGEKQNIDCQMLKQALDVMLSCLQSVNDSLKNIIGFDKLLMVGRLIFHGPVEVETKRNRVRVSMRNISR